MKLLAPALLLIPFLFPSPAPAADASRGPDVVIAGDSYSVGVLGSYFEKTFKGQGQKVSRYGISSSFVKHWLEKSPSDKTVGPGVGVDWVSPGQSGSGHAPADYPKLREILMGEAKNAKMLVIILGTNGICQGRTVSDAGALAEQATAAIPGIKCFWVGPELFRSECGGDFKRQREFSMALGQAVSGNCTFIDSTTLGLDPGQAPHRNDNASAWAAAVATKLK